MVMAETTTSSSFSSSLDDSNVTRNKLWKVAFAVTGIMLTLVTYGVLQVTFTLHIKPSQTNICVFFLSFYILELEHIIAII
jgi:hypothetical protein